MSVWRASAPANIALIKYMGKADITRNQPTNSSLSWTLNHLQTHVELELSSEGSDSWQPLGGFTPLQLSAHGEKRYLQHLDRVKTHFGYKGFFKVRSANGFPADCGLASSASSFAALTLCAFKAMSELTGQAMDLEALGTRLQMAQISQLGSGSSARSFFSPWAMGLAKGAEPVDLPGADFLHQVVIVDAGVKRVSSSEAHKIVGGSLLFAGRAQRAEQRLEALIRSLQQGQWREAYAITWAEFWDMHALFETAPTPFGYMTAGSIAVLERVREHWQRHGDGPLVTMDAGANVHFIYRKEQFAQARELADQFGVRVLANHEGLA